MEERNEGKERELRSGNVLGDVLFLLLFIAVLILSYLISKAFVAKLVTILLGLCDR